jgi:hypothetical protein
VERERVTIAVKQFDHLAYAFCADTIGALVQDNDKKFRDMIAIVVCVVPGLISLLCHVKLPFQKPLQSIDALINWGFAQVDALQ